MRDVRNATKVCVKEMRTKTGSLTFSLSTTAQTLKQFRADAVSTLRFGEVYTKPTVYGGYFFWSSTDTFSYVAKSTNPAATGDTYTGESCTGDITAVNLGTMFCSPVTLYPSFGYSYQSILDAKLLKRSIKNDWDLGTSLAEARESIQFVVETVGWIAKLATLIKRGDFLQIGHLLSQVNARRRQMVRSGRSVYSIGEYTGAKGEKFIELTYLKPPSKTQLRKAVRKGFASGWLAYQFAVVPLMNDVYQALSAVREGIKTPDAISAKARVDVAPAKPPAARSGIPWTSSKWSFKGELEGKIVYKVDNRTLAQFEALGLTDPLGIAWDLLPLSFVLDWFLPVGDFLAAFHRPWGYTFSHGYNTRYLKWSLAVVPLLVKDQVGYKWWTRLKDPYIQAGCIAFDRAVYLSWPIPAPHFRGFGNLASSYGKSISLLALALK